MTTKLDRLADGTIELTLTISWNRVKSAYEKTVDEIVENTQLDGFRKGKAPKNLVVEKLDRGKTYETMLQKLLPEVYNQAITDYKLKPIINPKIELKEAEEDKDWIIRVLTCEKPTFTIGDYKKAIRDLKAGKLQKIWTPGEDKKPQEEEEKAKKVTLDEILKAVFECSTITIPALLVDQEVNRLLSDLIDQTKKLGLSVEQYLSSTQRSQESIRTEYKTQAQRTITLEFALEAIADLEAILISDDDLAHVIKTAKTEDEKKALEGQKYYLASVLRRQKTLDFLADL